MKTIKCVTKHILFGYWHKLLAEGWKRIIVHVDITFRVLNDEQNTWSNMEGGGYVEKKGNLGFRV